jgi:hypothetical protein
MLLTRPQILCAWAIASEQPTNSEFDLSVPDDKGAVYLQVKSPYGQATFKLPREGGRIKITEQGTLTPPLETPPVE